MCQGPDFIEKCERLSDHGRKPLEQRMYLVTTCCVYRAFGLRKGNRKTDQCRQLCSKSLRAGDADFGTGTRRHDKVGFPRDGATGNIDKADGSQPGLPA